MASRMGRERPMGRSLTRFPPAQQTTPASEWRAEWLWLTLIVAYAVVVRSYNLTEPWGRHQLGINGAWQSHIARNFLRYGFIATHGAPVLNSSAGLPETWSYYLHHPPLVFWLLALSFDLLGVYEWSARLPTLGFALLCVVLTHRLARRLLGSPAALVAAAVTAAVPMSAIYSMHVDVTGPFVLAFVLLAVNAYARLAERRYRHGCTMLAAVLVGCLADWPAFYLPPLLFAHQLTRPRSDRSPAVRWTLGASAVLAGGLLLYFDLLQGGLGEQVHQLRVRTAHLQDDVGQGFTVVAWLQVTVARFWQLYTPPLALAVCCWVVAASLRWARGRLHPADTYVWLLLAFGTATLLVAFQAAYQHESAAYYLTPAASLCAAEVVSAVWLQATQRLPHRLAVAIAATLALTLATWWGAVSIARPQAQRRQLDAEFGYAAADLGRVVRDHTAPGEGAIVAENWCPPALWFYAERPLVPIMTTVETLREDLDRPRYRAPECFAETADEPIGAVVVPKALLPRAGRLVEFLRARFQAHEDGEFIVFRVR